MKTLKVNSLLLSIFAVALISSFLTSCEKNESIDVLNNEVLNHEVLNQKVASAIEDIDLLPSQAFDNIPTYLPTETEIGEMRLNSRANTTSVNASISQYIIATETWDVINGLYVCNPIIEHNADWDPSYGTCAPSNWTWYNVQKRRANGNFTTESSGLKYGDYQRFSPNNLSSGEYISAIFAWNKCQKKWTLEATMGPYIAPCAD